VALLERLRAGPVAVRYHDCQVELLPACKVTGTGEIREAHGCCDTAIGCVGAPGVECVDAEERYWFGGEVEWLLNLPELQPRWSSADVAALRVAAGVRTQYRAMRDSPPKTTCSEATHVIVGARFGKLRVEAERARQPGSAVERWVVVAPQSEETLIDVTLQSVGEQTGRAGAACMGLAGYRTGWEPASFQGQTYIAPPSRCTFECASGRLDCEQACRSGVRAACDRDHMAPTEPALAPWLDAACSAGFGAGCVERGGANRARLAAVCDEGGDRSARVCGDLSLQTSDAQALEYAWRACARGRIKCERFAQLAVDLGVKTDPRYGQALRFGCASGRSELCCELGVEQFEQGPSKNDGVALLNEYCGRSVQACCTALRQRKLPVPSRRRQPD